MHIRVICLGRTDQSFIEEGLELYKKRLKHYGRFEWVELDNKKLMKQQDKEVVKQDEWKLIERHIGDQGWQLWLCDEAGKEYTSVSFAHKLDQTFNTGLKGLSICIGGPFGFPDVAKQKADLLLSLSQMTMTHQMVRLVLAEQVYRAMKINSNEGYHY